MIYLKQGDTGANVKTLQTALNALGHNCGAVDGIWGPKTEAAVRAFQTAQNLGIDQDGYNLAVQLATPKKPSSPHFRLEEFEVHDKALESLWEPIPSAYYPDVQELMNRLEKLRALANERYAAGGEVQIHIRSGYRCKAYNAKVGGASGSRHLTASAADVYAVRILNGKQQARVPNCYQLAQLCNELWPKTGGYGLGANINLHIDLRSTRTIWWYTYTSWAAWERGQGAAA